MTNKTLITRIKDASEKLSELRNHIHLKQDENKFLVQNRDVLSFALAYLEASINDLTTTDEPASFDMLQGFMEGDKNG